MFGKLFSRNDGKDLVQSGGETSTNYQAGANLTVYQNGLSLTEAKELVLLVMEQNFIKFSDQALNTAKARAEEMTTAYLDGLAARNQNLIEEVQEPGVQMAIVAAQKEYVKTGDENLIGLLVTALVERTAQKQRTLLQITLDECLSVIGRLTNKQIDTALLFFLLSHMRKHNLNTLETFKSFCDTHLEPLVPSVSKGEADCTHLVATNCATILNGPRNFLETWLNIYQGLFNKGIPKDVLESFLQENPEHVNYTDNSKFPSLFIQCLHNAELLQIGFLDKDTFESNMTLLNINENTAGKLRGFFNIYRMSPEEAKTYLITFGNYMEQLFNLWNGQLLSAINLTNIGQAVAITAYKAKYSDPISYSTWIDT